MLNFSAVAIVALAVTVMVLLKKPWSNLCSEKHYWHLDDTQLR